MSQEAAIRRICAKLEVTSNGTTTAWNSAAAGHPASKAPTTGDIFPPHRRFREWYDGQESDLGRQRVISAAEEEWKRLTGRVERQRKEETLEQRNKRLVKEGEGWTTAEVALAFRCSEREVMRARRDAGVCVETGRRPVEKLETLERRSEVERLKEKGMSIRNIALRLGVAKVTVERDLAA